MFLYVPPESSGSEQKAPISLIGPDGIVVEATNRPHWPSAAGIWMGEAELNVTWSAFWPIIAAPWSQIITNFCSRFALYGMERSAPPAPFWPAWNAALRATNVLPSVM